VDEEIYIKGHFLPMVTKLAYKKQFILRSIQTTHVGRHKCVPDVKNVNFSKNYCTYFGNALGTPHFLYIQLIKYKLVF